VEKFNRGYIKHNGEPAESIVDEGQGVAVMKLGTIGVTVKIIPPGAELPDDFEIAEDADVEPVEQAADTGGGVEELLEEEPEEIPDVGEDEDVEVPTETPDDIEEGLDEEIVEEVVEEELPVEDETADDEAEADADEADAAADLDEDVDEETMDEAADLVEEMEAADGDSEEEDA
jgi:small subunit ribosomal protein S3